MKNLHSQIEFFYNTKNWKNYWVNGLKELIKGKVMDIGTGIGSNLPFYLNLKTIKKLVCLEPDIKLYKKIKKKFHKTKKNKIFFKNTDLLKLRSKEKFDTIIYADVLEHIKNDFKEIKLAINHLKIGGRLIILSPAHNYLFSIFDKNVGHYRRYNKKMFIRLKVSKTKIEKLYYLDSLGFFLSLLNKTILNRNPKKKEIKFWDNVVVPISKVTDYLSSNLFGKSIICVYKKKVDN